MSANKPMGIGDINQYFPRTLLASSVPPQVPSPCKAKAKKKRTYKTRDGEVVGKDLRQQILSPGGCALKKSALTKMNKLQLCDIAKGLGLLSEKGYLASLARKSEGHKCYLTTMVRDKRLLAQIDDYVTWWSEVYARGTLIADGFAISHPNMMVASLMDLTFLKKVLLPERYTVSELPSGLPEYMSGDTRRAAFISMATTMHINGALADQGMTYIARRFRGAIKGHIMTHLHTRIFDMFAKRFHALDRHDELHDAIKRALIGSDFSGLSHYPEESWQIIKLGGAPPIGANRSRRLCRRLCADGGRNPQQDPSWP